MFRLRQAFTIAEFFVVTAIIAILSLSIIFFGHTGHSIDREKIEIVLELQQLGSAIEDFNNTYGAYPPNAMPNAVQVAAEPTEISPSQDFLKMFRKAFPRSLESEDVICGLTGEGEFASSLPYGLTASESLFFWLGGFSNDPQYPLSGPGGPSFSDVEGNNDGVLDAKDENISARNYSFEFDLGNLVPKTKKDLFIGRFIEYGHPRDGQRRRINFWQYVISNSTMAAVYFDASRYLPAEYYPFENPSLGNDVAPLMQIGEDTNQFQFVNQGKFQILHAGRDNVWGDFSGIRNGELLFPKGPFTGDLADTLTHFTIDMLENEQE